MVMKQLGFFDESSRLKKLSQLGDSLEKLDKVINWEMFRAILDEVFRKEPKGAGGRPPYDYVLLLKILILQRIYNLSDDQTEYQINDRMSFMRFLGLGLGDRVPDAKTIWLFRDTLTKTNIIHKIFELFNHQLENAHLITHTGSIVDATFVDAPRQRNSRDENAKIKVGEIPEEWGKPENAHKLAQKDTEARWTKKGNEVHYGYKDHVKVDVDSKLITEYTVTPASVHDSHELLKLLNKTDNELYADGAYSGAPIAEALPKNVTSHIHGHLHHRRHRPGRPGYPAAALRQGGRDAARLCQRAGHLPRPADGRRAGGQIHRQQHHRRPGHHRRAGGAAGAADPFGERGSPAAGERSQVPHRGGLHPLCRKPGLAQPPDASALCHRPQRRDPGLRHGAVPGVPGGGRSAAQRRRPGAGAGARRRAGAAGSDVRLRHPGEAAAAGLRHVCISRPPQLSFSAKMSRYSRRSAESREYTSSSVSPRRSQSD